jgi:hypothetical protein
MAVTVVIMLATTMVIMDLAPSFFQSSFFTEAPLSPCNQHHGPPFTCPWLQLRLASGQAQSMVPD